MKQLILVAICCILAVGCATTQHGKTAKVEKCPAVLINGSPAQVTFQLNGRAYQVAPFSHKEIEVEVGPYRLVIIADINGQTWVGEERKGTVVNVPIVKTLPNGEVKTYGWACSFHGSFN